MVEEYLRDLPELVRGAGLEAIREYDTVPEERTEGNPLGVYTLTPERVRERTTEELEEIRRERGEQLRALYEVLRLSVVAQRDGTLDVSWSAGDSLDRCKLAGSGR